MFSTFPQTTTSRWKLCTQRQLQSELGLATSTLARHLCDAPHRHSTTQKVIHVLASCGDVLGLFLP